MPKPTFDLICGSCVVTIGRRVLSPDEYSVDHKAGTVTLLGATAGQVCISSDYLRPAKHPRKKAQWKRKQRGRV